MAKIRAKGEGTISQRSSDGRWIGQLTLGIINGKQIKKSVSAASQAECKKKFDELKRQYENKPFVSPTKSSYVDYLETWLEQKEKLERLKPSTIFTHKSRINSYIKPYFKKTEIQKITVQMLHHFYTSLTNKISAHTIHKVHNIINNSLVFAVRDGLITYNPAANVLLPKFKIKRSSAIAENQLPLLLEAARTYQNQPTTKSKNVYPLIMLALNTGMRRGELAGLQWSNVNLNTGAITIEHAVIQINGKCHLDTPKNESSHRTIHISPSMTELLKEHQVNAPGLYVFPSSNNPNQPVCPDNICRFFRSVIKLANINSNFHSLRHTHITHLLESGINIKTIQDRVGHTQISTTMGYCHPSKEKDIEAANIFEKFYN